jgi:hypothetical protein
MTYGSFYLNFGEDTEIERFYRTLYMKQEGERSQKTTIKSRVEPKTHS